MNNREEYLQLGLYTKDCPKEILDKVVALAIGVVNEDNLFILLETIREEFSQKRYTIYKTKDFRESRFISVGDILKKRQESCGAWATVVASVLRNFEMPTKLINGYYGEETPDMRHAWNEVYINGGWLSVDLTRKDFKINNKHIKVDEWVDWSDLEKVYKAPIS